MGAYDRLKGIIIRNSVHKTWAEAAREWEIVGCMEDITMSKACICGHEHLKYLYEIRNRENGATLFPIGRTCLKKFGRGDINEDAAIDEQLFKLLWAAERGRYISLTPDFFSRRLLKRLLDDGAFPPSKYNRFNGKNDYDFMLKMFNKRNELTDKEKSRVRALIFFSIKPYLQKKLEGGAHAPGRG